MSVESTSAAASATETDPVDPVDPVETSPAASTTATRRAFIGGAGTAVAVGGLMAVVPKFANGGGDSDAGRAVQEAADRLHVSADDPLVVHVSDLSSGEINLYAGDQHIVIHDTDLATRLAGAVTRS